MTDMQKLRVFLSYTHADISPIRKLYQDLTAQGYEVWFDEENLIAGQEWKTEIERALETSDVVVVCLSTNSVSREGYIQREFRYAMDKALEMTDDGIFLIPIRLNECKVPAKLSRYHWVDLFTDNGFSRLQKALAVRASQVSKRNEVTQQPPVEIPVPNKEVITDPPKVPTSKPARSSQDIKPASFSWMMNWSLTYLPLLPFIVALFIGFETESIFSNTALYALLAVLSVSVIQWLILRSHFEKASRWILFNMFVSIYTLVLHMTLEFVYEGLVEWLNNKSISFDQFSFWAFSFWVILLTWAAVNFYAGVLVSKADLRIKHFFTDAILNITFLNQWGSILFISLPLTILILSGITSVLNYFGLGLDNKLAQGIIGIVFGFFQWLILRRRLNFSWWIAVNFVLGLISGWAVDLNSIRVGFFIDNLVLLLWVVLNMILGPLLLLVVSKRQMPWLRVKTV